MTRLLCLAGNWPRDRASSGAGRLSPWFRNQMSVVCRGPQASEPYSRRSALGSWRSSAVESWRSEEEGITEERKKLESPSETPDARCRSGELRHEGSQIEARYVTLRCLVGLNLTHSYGLTECYLVSQVGVLQRCRMSEYAISHALCT